MRPFNPPRGVLGPFGPKVGNGVENEFSGPSGPGVQKVENRVEKESKSGNSNSFSNFFDSFSTLFLAFWAPGPEGPGNSFSTVSNFGPEGPKNSSGGIEGSQHKHKLFGPVGFGTTPGLSQGQTGFVPATNPGQTHVFSLFYTVEAQFVPGTNPVCPRDKPSLSQGQTGGKGQQKKFMC